MRPTFQLAMVEIILQCAAIDTNDQLSTCNDNHNLICNSHWLSPFICAQVTASLFCWLTGLAFQVGGVKSGT